jgi:hypothetical protein
MLIERMTAGLSFAGRVELIVQGFTGTRRGYAPACGVNAPIRWVP